MTFSLTLSSSDLLLLLPEIFLTCWLCVVLIVDFSFPRLPKENLAYLSVAGLLVTLGCLGWFDFAGISGALFSNMFVVDRMALAILENFQGEVPESLREYGAPERIRR